MRTSLAPSTRPASMISVEIPLMAAEKITIAKPVCSQAIMTIKKRLFQGIMDVSTYQACGSPPRATIIAFRMPGEARDMASVDGRAVVLAEWMEENLEAEDLCLIGPDDVYEFDWNREVPGRRQQVPYTAKMSSLVEEARRIGATHVIITSGLVNERPFQFGGIVRFGENGMVVDEIKGLERVWEDPEAPIDFVIFEVE